MTGHRLSCILSSDGTKRCTCISPGGALCPCPLTTDVNLDLLTNMLSVWVFPQQTYFHFVNLLLRILQRKFETKKYIQTLPTAFSIYPLVDLALWYSNDDSPRHLCFFYICSFFIFFLKSPFFPVYFLNYLL